ncbi:MAG: metallophosphoesterase [Motiliproteus sp.]
MSDKALTLTAVSDIHLCFDERDDLFQLPVPDDVDLVMMAGDIADGCKNTYLDWILNATNGKPVAYTLGNHELYGTRRDKAIRECRTAFTGTHVNFLLNDSFVINDIRIAGTDLWTDFLLDGQGPASIRDAEAKMNDYRKIRVKVKDAYGDRYRKLRGTDTMGWHQQAKCFIRDTLNTSEEPVILMTHHGVSRKCVSPGYEGDVLNGAYTSNLEPLLEECKQQPILCVYGHTHQYLCSQLDCGSVLYTNQRGYTGFDRVEGFNPAQRIWINKAGQVTVEK